MTWSLDNIDSHLPGHVWESFATHHVAAGILVGTLALALSYPVFHKIYLLKSKRYREELTLDQQIIVIQHSVQALFLSLLYWPYTYVVLSINFEEQPLEGVGNKFTAMAAFMSVITIMYLIEIASRFSNLRGLVVAHHLCAYLDGIVTAYFLGTANVKAASLLVYFITYEAPTFVGLVMYRLVPEHKWTQPAIVVGMLVFGLSRPLQCLWIVAGLVETWDNIIVWQGIFQVILTSMFTILQLYSLTIHYSLYKKIGARRRLSLPKDSVQTRHFSLDDGVSSDDGVHERRRSSVRGGNKVEKSMASTSGEALQSNGALKHDEDDEESFTAALMMMTTTQESSIQNAKLSEERPQHQSVARSPRVFDGNAEFSGDDANNSLDRSIEV